jgi:cell wall-associated NlpC family hydrolase
MMTPAQIDALEAAAAAAHGRKELRCQCGMADVYKAAALLPADLAIPEGPRDAARWGNTSIFREWLEGPGSAYFREVLPPPLPGDLLCFSLGRIEHHVAILLRDGRLVHVFGLHGLQIAPCIPAPWAKRLSSIWRLR